MTGRLPGCGRTIRLIAGLLAGAAGPSGMSAAAPAPQAVSVAAAANFVYALDDLHAAFRRLAPEVALTSATGASGSLFAQIAQGAPFDVFLSADTDYPQRLVAAGHGDAATLCTFAAGRLVLWTVRADLDVADFAATVRSPLVRKLAIAQPRTAPYGRAAEAVLDRLGLAALAAPKLVLGENITQTAQFVETASADAGFVALSLVLSPRLARRGRWHEVPPELYAAVPLDHAAVLTKRGAVNPAAHRYLDFLASPAARAILERYGYRVPAVP